MAQLSSPGVSVSVIDESAYTSAAPGTVPLIFVTSEEGKQNASGTGTAPGTLKTNAGKVYLLTSQKELADTFGTPIFKTDANNNAVHAGEQNEFGLQAAYSFLGVSNRAYVARADIDLSQLDANATAPLGEPANNTFWLNTLDTKWGVFEWDSRSADLGGQTYTVKKPIVITSTVIAPDGTPVNTYGLNDTYAIVAVSTVIALWYKDNGSWVKVGTSAWRNANPTVIATANTFSATATSNDITINGIAIDNNADLAALVSGINASSALIALGITAGTQSGKLVLYSTGVAITLSGALVDGLGLSSTTYPAPALWIGPHTSIPPFKANDENRPSGSVWVKTTTPNNGADLVTKVYSTDSGSWVSKYPRLFPSHEAALAGLDPVSGGLSLAGNTMYIKYNVAEGVTSVKPDAANFTVYRRRSAVSTSIVSFTVVAETGTGNGHLSAGAYAFTLQESVPGSDTLTTAVTVSFTVTSGQTAASIASAIVTAISTQLSSYRSNVAVSLVTGTTKISIEHRTGGEIKLNETVGTPIVKLFKSATGPFVTNLYQHPDGITTHFIASTWTSLLDDNTGGFISAQDTAVTGPTVDGRLWYSSVVDEIDLLIHNGTKWVGYLHPTSPTYAAGALQTDPAGIIVGATTPTTQTDGTPLANGDIWLDSSDLENYPMLYSWAGFTRKWLLIDKSDQTTDNGILFADARWATTGQSETPSAITDLLVSDFVEFDAPDPALYPKGMLLWNLRRSGFNVKRFVRNYVNLTERNVRYSNESQGTSGNEYYPHKWVSESANQENGAGTFGRHAQRKVVVQKLQALVNSNQQIRDEESRLFNLIAAPGYPELIGEMINLNYDRGLTAFVVGDTPARLTPDATTLSSWGNNDAGALEDNDHGLVSSDEYLAVFYPWGYTSDNIGNNIAVPPSHMMLRTIALNDQIAYPWFAPAGTSRGGITNATSVGYITAEGEFQSVALNVGQRDTLASIKVNSITFIAGSGLVNFAQYTRARATTALDRINVARLVCYLRRQFAQLSKPYLFEPNDKVTRDQIKSAAENLLLELVGQRALYDYLVVCDESNNTPARIDRSELYLDVAVEPVKAVEFIYIPLRIKNTGEIKALGNA